MNSEEIRRDWQRLTAPDNTPVYVRPDTPDWLVPNAAGDSLLQACITDSNSLDIPSAVGADDFFPERLRFRQFLAMFTSPSTEPYQGRAEHLSLEALEECWLHITDRCNLSCRHCLFACSAKTRTTLSGETVAAVVDAACGLGARTFFLTGGEPLLHPDFSAICRHILDKNEDTRLVILTNGILIPEQIGFLLSLPGERLFLQVSVDGIETVNDALRGKGVFRKLRNCFQLLSGTGMATTLSMAVHADNHHQMPDIVDLAADYNLSGVHYMWLLVTGKAGPQAFVPPDLLFERLLICQERAQKRRVTIDNIRNFASRVFSPPGTKYDLGNAGWSSLAVGPKGGVYPTPALIGRKEVYCGSIDDGLKTVWHTSPVLRDLRGLSLLQDADCVADPLRFIVGGGDIDHSYYAGGHFLGWDPYLPLYRKTALWLMADSARLVPERPWPQARRKMGEKLLQCIGNGEGVALTHSNCVLTFSGTHQVVGAFYAAADESENDDIINPVCYPEDEISHIPGAGRVRSYGCGSPVLDAAIEPGQVVVDLGSGAGVECYMAARKTGPSGRVIGIDMMDPMLAKAIRFREAVARNLGFENVFFQKALLEALPLAGQSVDVVISNCVINLSEDKRQTFAEIFRILKPGGRICISDVVTDTPCSPSIQNDAKLRGECISGALLQLHLVAVLEAAGFRQIRFRKRFFYRRVQNHDFYSVTYTACRPPVDNPVRAVYPGPYAAVMMDSGEVLLRGETTDVNWPDSAGDDPAVFLLDGTGSVSNHVLENPCGCGVPMETAAGCDCSAPPEAVATTTGVPLAPAPGLSCGPGHPTPVAEKSMADCMVCGRPLQYLDNDRQETCVLCGRSLAANAICTEGHFVCDACHSRDILKFVRYVCTHTEAADMIELLNQLRRHPSFPLHGPEHHFAIPGVILAVYRNLGGAVTEADILTAIDRGRNVPGGACGFWGTCGAAIGVGIAFGIILHSNPLAPQARQQVQQISQAVIKKLNIHEAARCCQREAWTALVAAAELSKVYLPVKLKAQGDVQCRQQGKNQECIRQACPYFQIDS